VSVILSVVEACHTAPRVSALPVLLSIISVAELVLLCWPNRVAIVSVTRPARPEPSLNLDKVFEDEKI